MSSYLIAKDIGFIFKDDFAQHSGANTSRLNDYSEILRDQNAEVVDLINRAQTGVNEISRTFLDKKTLPNKSQTEIISLFEDLRDFSENPYKVAKYLFKKESENPQLEYSNLIAFLTKQRFTDLYQKVAANEPELRFDYKDNALEFYDAAKKLPLKESSYRDDFSKSFKLFEVAAEKFGDSSQIFRLQFLKGKGPHIYSEHRTYLNRLLETEKITPKQYSQEEIVSCILPKESDLKLWKSEDPQIFFSFQVPQNNLGISFNSKEKDFFRSVAAEAQKDIIVPVAEIILSPEELKAVSENKLDKNIFFIMKDEISGNAAYPVTKDDFENKVSHKIIILPTYEVFKSEHMALHQLAIGVADLKHPSFYMDSIDAEPNCDLGVTTSQTVMSHICDTKSYSSSCFNIFNAGKKDVLGKNFGFSEADVKAMTTSLTKQFPSIAVQVNAFENQREFCQDERNSYAAVGQIMLAAVLFFGAARYLTSYLQKPKNTPLKTNSSKVAEMDNQHEH